VSQSMNDFVHLHVHSHYSLMDGLCSPEELLKAAKDIGQTTLSVTDHGTLSSHREMQKAAKDLGMKPILGVEAYISETDRFDKRDVKARDDNTQVFNHIILLARDQQGLKNLQQLSELAWSEGFYRKPRIDLEVLGLRFFLDV
jgi:DNA polymerase III subunit alpha